MGSRYFPVSKKCNTFASLSVRSILRTITTYWMRKATVSTAHIQVYRQRQDFLLFIPIQEPYLRLVYRSIRHSLLFDTSTILWTYGSSTNEARTYCMRRRFMHLDGRNTTRICCEFLCVESLNTSRICRIVILYMDSRTTSRVDLQLSEEYAQICHWTPKKYSANIIVLCNWLLHIHHPGHGQFWQTSLVRLPRVSKHLESHGYPIFVPSQTSDHDISLARFYFHHSLWINRRGHYALWWPSSVDLTRQWQRHWLDLLWIKRMAWVSKFGQVPGLGLAQKTAFQGWAA